MVVRVVVEPPKASLQSVPADASFAPSSISNISFEASGPMYEHPQQSPGESPIIDYAEWAVGQPDVDIKIEALNRLVDEFGNLNDHFHKEELSYATEVAKELYYDLLHHAKDSGLILPFDWLRTITRDVTQLQIAQRSGGFSVRRNAMREEEEKLIKEFDKLVAGIKGPDGLPISINDQIPPFSSPMSDYTSDSDPEIGCFTRALFYRDKEAYDERSKEARETQEYVERFKLGMERRGLRQAEFLAGIKKIYDTGYDQLIDQSSMCAGDERIFSSAAEAEFEKALYWADILIRASEASMAVTVLQELFKKVDVEAKKRTVLVAILGARDRQIEEGYIPPHEKFKLANEEINDARELVRLVSGAKSGEIKRWLLTADFFKSKASAWLNRKEKAFIITDSVLKYIADLNTREPETGEAEGIFQLGMLRLQYISRSAVEASKSGESPDSDKFAGYLQMAETLIDSLEKLSARYGSGDNFLAELRGVRASMLWMDKRWHDAAEYVRDSIDKPFWNTPYSLYLRDNYRSFIPASLRISGKIPDNLSDVNWENIGDRLGALTRESSAHLFDHSWYVTIGASIGGCAVGSLATSGPWGCPAGAGLAMGGDMFTSSLMADETWQAFYSGYTATTALDVGLNSSIGGISLALTMVGFKWTRLPLGNIGKYLAEGSTWARLGTNTLEAAKTGLGFGKGLANTTLNTARGVGRTGHQLVSRAVGKIRPVVDAQLAEVISVGTADIVDPALKVNGIRLWRVLAGMPRDLAPAAEVALHHQSLVVRAGSVTRVLKWNPFLSKFEFAGVWGTTKGLVDTAFHVGERISAPYLVGELIFRKRGEDEPKVSIFGAFASMFVFTRVGIQYFGVDKGGTRTMLLLDRLQDVFNQMTSGQPIGDIDWEIAALTYITGSVPGQVRGRWLKNLLGKHGSLEAGLEVKIGDFASGKLPWSNLTEAERRVMEKILHYANANGIVVLQRGEGGVVNLLAQNIFTGELKPMVTRGGKVVETLSDDEWKMIRRFIRPIKLRMEEFGSGSSFKAYLEGQVAVAEGEAREIADRSLRLVNKLEAMIPSVAEGVKQEILIRNNVVFIRVKNGLNQVGALTPAEQKLLRSFATPIKYEVGRFIPGGETYLSLASEEQQVALKLFQLANGDVSERLTIQGGKVLSKSVVSKGRVLGVLTPAEEIIFRRFMEPYYSALSLSKAAGPVYIKVGTSLNWKGILLFCFIHDTLIGTVYDDIRGQLLLKTTPLQMGKWTLARSLTTLPPRNFMKLKSGWDKPLAVAADRLFGRNFIDPVLTKWFPLWSKSGFWKKGYGDSFAEGRVSDFVDYHVASGMFEGGLFTYNINTIPTFVGIETDGSPYTASGVSFEQLGELYSDGKMTKKATLLPTDYAKLDDVIDELLDNAESIIKKPTKDLRVVLDDGEYYRSDSVVDLALGVTAAAIVARQKNPYLFQKSLANHPQLFNFVEHAMRDIADTDVPTSNTIVNFMDDMVDDGVSAPPAGVREALGRQTP